MRCGSVNFFTHDAGPLPRKRQDEPDQNDRTPDKKTSGSRNSGNRVFCYVKSRPLFLTRRRRPAFRYDPHSLHILVKVKIKIIRLVSEREMEIKER